MAWGGGEGGGGRFLRRSIRAPLKLQHIFIQFKHSYSFLLIVFKVYSMRISISFGPKFIFHSRESGPGRARLNPLHAMGLMYMGLVAVDRNWASRNVRRLKAILHYALGLCFGNLKCAKTREKTQLPRVFTQRIV